MCSPMPDIDPDDLDGPPPCLKYPECESQKTCNWPECRLNKEGCPGCIVSENICYHKD